MLTEIIATDIFAKMDIQTAENINSHPIQRPSFDEEWWTFSLERMVS